MIFSALMLVLLAACGTDSEDTGGAANGSLKVVTSFTIIDDLAKEIGGENVEVHNLVPTGTDPHEYEPLPEDTKHVADADVLFYNGRSEEHTSELQSRGQLVCRLLLQKKK